jgi:hypothetical protein
VKLIMRTDPIKHGRPLSQLLRNQASRKYGKGFHRQRKVTLPITAWRSVDLLAARLGISVPGLLLALTNAEQATIDQLRQWAVEAAIEHGHFLSVENEDGTRSRVGAGRYRRGGE